MNLGANRTRRLLAVTLMAATGVGCAMVAGLEDHHLADTDAAPPLDAFAGGDDGSDANAPADAPGDVPAPPTDASTDAAPSPPETLATGQGGPREIAIDTKYVYWVNESTGTLVRLPKAGGTAVVLATGLAGPQHIALDDQRVYVQCYNGGGTAGAAAVVAVRKEPADASGDVLTLVSGNAGGRAAALALPDSIFLADAGTGDAAPADDYVWFIDVPGLSARRVSRQGPVNSDTLVGAILYSTAAKPVSPAIAVDDQNVYYGDQTAPPGPSPNLVRAKRDGTGGSTVFALGSKVIDLRLDAQSVYWIVPNGAVNRLDKTLAGTAPTVLANDASNPEGIALDASYVYWTNPGGGDVRRVPKTTGKATPIASAQAGPSGIAVDVTAAGTVVYWTNRGDGSVMRVLSR